jgi:hypothetical protein
LLKVGGTTIYERNSVANDVRRRGIGVGSVGEIDGGIVCASYNLSVEGKRREGD